MLLVTSTSPISQVTWHPFEAGRFSVTSDEKAVEIWDIRAPRMSTKFVSSGLNLFSSWSPDGKYIALVNKSNFITVFDVITARQIKKVKFLYEINELQWTANSDYLLVATASSDQGKIEVLAFDGEELELVESISGHTGTCLCLKVDPIFRRVAVGAADYNLTLWHLDTLVCRQTIPFE